MDRFILEFTLVDGESYALWYMVGGGGGHQLMVRDTIVRIFVLDDQESGTWRETSMPY